MDNESSTSIKSMLIFVSVFLVIFLAFFFLFWRPTTSSLRNYQTELSNKEAELIQLERDAKDWPDSITRDRLKQYESELERLWELIPTKEEVAMLIDEIQTHARACDLQIQSLVRIQDRQATSRTVPGKDQDQPKQESKYVKVPYQIALGGSYFGLIRFLQRLEDSKRLVTITSIKVNAGKEDLPMDSEVQFNIYYSKVGVEKG
jgi:Tfp pilus assembly protein PilO